MDAYLEPIFRPINNPLVPMWLALGIFAYAAIVWVVFYSRTFPIRRNLNQAIKRIKNTPNDEKGFFEHYQSVNDALSENKFLRHVWYEFTENLIVDDENQRIRNSYPADAFFNEQKIVKPKINLTFYQAFPNKLVGIGLLFTFIGLVAALYFASKGVSAGSTEQAKEALSHLLNAATFKFSTSIAGLFASLLFSWGEKHRLHSIHKKLEHLCRLLDERLSFVTPEILADEQLQELKKQTIQLERFNTDFAVEIAERLEQPMSNALNKEIAPLIESLEKMTANIGGVSQDALEKMVSSFGEKLHGSAGKEMSELGETLSGLTRSIESVTSNMETSMNAMNEDLGRQIQSLGSTLSNGANEFTQAVSSSAESMDSQLSQTAQRLEGSMTEFTQSVDRLGETTSKVSGVTEKIGELAHDFDEPIRNLKEAGRPLQSLSESLTQLIDKLQQSSEQTDASLRALQSAANDIRGTSTTVQNTLTEYKKNFEKIDDSTAQVFQQINSGLEAYTSQIMNFVSGLDQSFEKALQALSATISSLQDTVDELNESQRS